MPAKDLQQFCNAQLLRRHVPCVCGCPGGRYVSLFPLLMELIPADSPILGQQLELLRDPQLLWTDHGLRSLRCV